MGINQFNRKWNRIDTYFGKLVENLTQAIARDVMTHNMPTIDAAGYEIVLSVHDELICETPDTPDYNVATLSKMLAAPPPWALDMPLAAAGFETHAYRKD
jgi:DNA polymerase